MEKQSIVHKKYYPYFIQIVYAPQWYIPTSSGKDDYSCKVFFSKTEDKTDLFLPKILQLLKELRAKRVLEKIDFVTVMPKHTKDEYSVTLQAMGPIIAKELNAQYILLINRVRLGNRKSTDFPTLDERYTFEKDSMKVIDNMMLKDKNILLLDDVKTTGIAIMEATKILLHKGVAHVLPVCLGINNSYFDKRWGGQDG